MDVPYIWNTYQMILFHEKAWEIYIYKNYKKWASITLKKKDRWGLCIIQAAGRRGKWRIWLSDTNSDERPRTREAKWMQLFNECRHGPWFQRVKEVIKRIWCSYRQNKWGFPGDTVVKKIHLPTQEMWVWSLGQENSLEKEMATYPSNLAGRIPWTEEPGGLQSIGLQSWAWLRDWVHTGNINTSKIVSQILH